MSTTVKAPAAEAIVQAWKAMGLFLRTVPAPQDRAARKAVGNAAVDLRDYLELYDAVSGGTLHAEAVYPDLVDVPEPVCAALDKLAEEAADAADRLTGAVARYCGEDAAEHVHGLEGGTQ